MLGRAVVPQPATLQPSLVAMGASLPSAVVSKTTIIGTYFNEDDGCNGLQDHGTAVSVQPAGGAVAERCVEELAVVQELSGGVAVGVGGAQSDGDGGALARGSQAGELLSLLQQSELRMLCANCCPSCSKASPGCSVRTAGCPLLAAPRAAQQHLFLDTCPWARIQPLISFPATRKKERKRHALKLLFLRLL